MSDQIRDQDPQQGQAPSPAPEQPETPPSQPETPETPETPSDQPDQSGGDKRGGRRTSVFLYLVVLFAAAFTMLFMAYLMQQRSNDEAISSLQDSLASFQSNNELINENRELRAENEDFQAALDELEGELDDLQSRVDGLDDALDSQIQQNEAMGDQILFFTDYARLEHYLREEQFEKAAQTLRDIWDGFGGHLGDYVATFHSLDGAFGIPERLREVVAQLEGAGYLSPGELDLDELISSDSKGLVWEDTDPAS